MGEARVADLRKAYPELKPDKDYPPLEFRSLTGGVGAAEWEARVDCACAYRSDRFVFQELAISRAIGGLR